MGGKSLIAPKNSGICWGHLNGKIRNLHIFTEILAPKRWQISEWKITAEECWKMMDSYPHRNWVLLPGEADPVHQLNVFCISIIPYKSNHRNVSGWARGVQSPKRNARYLGSMSHHSQVQWARIPRDSFNAYQVIHPTNFKWCTRMCIIFVCHFCLGSKKNWLLPGIPKKNTTMTPLSRSHFLLGHQLANDDRWKMNRIFTRRYIFNLHRCFSSQSFESFVSFFFRGGGGGTRVPSKSCLQTLKFVQKKDVMWESD